MADIPLWATAFWVWFILLIVVGLCAAISAISAIQETADEVRRLRDEIVSTYGADPAKHLFDTNPLSRSVGLNKPYLDDIVDIQDH